MHPLTMDDSSASSGRYLLSTGPPKQRMQAGNQLPEAGKEIGNHKEGVGSLGSKVSVDVLSERGCWPRSAGLLAQRLLALCLSRPSTEDMLRLCSLVSALRRGWGRVGALPSWAC